MLIKHIFLGIVGLTSGFAVAGGTFALLTALSVIPRLIGKSKTAGEVFYYENVLMAGGILGNIATVYPKIILPFGSIFLIVYGISTGIWVGCLVMALAEIMNVFPIMFRRLNLKTGLSLAVTAMAIGKVIGGLWYFFQRIGQ